MALATTELRKLTFRYFTGYLKTHLSSNKPLLEELESRGHNVNITQWRNEDEHSKIIEVLDIGDILLIEDKSPARSEKHKNQIRIRALHGIGKFRWNRLPISALRYDMMILPTANWIPVFNRLCSNSIDTHFGIGGGWSKFDIYYKYLKNRKETREYIYNKYNFDKNKKLIIYGPTGIRLGSEHLDQWLKQGWPKDSYQRHGSAYLRKEVKEIIQRYGNMYEIEHPCLNEVDITEDRIPMMVAADMFIGDISSMTHEFSLIDKPIIQMMKNIEDRLSGDFHIFCNPNEETIDFGDIIDVKDLDKTIQSRLAKDSHRDRREYLKEKYVGICDGKAASREADAIEEFCQTLKL